MLVRRPTQVKGWLRFLLTIALVPLCFLLLPGSLRSRALGATFALVAAFGAFKMAMEGSRFKPFWIHVDPRWLPILADHGVISGPEGWESTAEARDSSDSEYDVLRDKIRFTFLTPEMAFDHGTNSFFTSLHFMASIKEIKQVAHRSEFHPKFYIEAGSEGYEFGLVTAKTSEAAYDLSDPKSRVKIATLPYTEFRFQWERSEYDAEFWRKARQKQDEQLKLHGWERDKTPNIPGDPHPFVSLEHKYFSLYYGNI